MCVCGVWGYGGGGRELFRGLPECVCMLHENRIGDIRIWQQQCQVTLDCPHFLAFCLRTVIGAYCNTVAYVDSGIQIGNFISNNYLLFPEKYVLRR